MGCYDSVQVPCPVCGKLYYAQSKGGPCKLKDYTLENAPQDVLSDINRHAPFFCPVELKNASGEVIDSGGCNTYFAVDDKTRKPRKCKNIDRKSLGWIDAFYSVDDPWVF